MTRHNPLVLSDGAGGWFGWCAGCGAETPIRSGRWVVEQWAHHHDDDTAERTD